MNRSAKTIIALLVLCVGALIFLLMQEKHDHRNETHARKINCQYGIVTSHTINEYIKALETPQSDSSWTFDDQYAQTVEYQYFWNNSQLFSLAYMMIDEENNHDSLHAIYMDYSSASTEIHNFLNTYESSAELKPGDLNTLLGYMHKLADATERFESFDFHE